MSILNSFFFFFSSRRRHTSFSRDWSSDVCSSDLCLTSACIFGQFRNRKLRNLLTYYKILDIKRKEEMKIKQLLLFAFVAFGYLFHASCEDEMASVVTDEPVKDIAGSWKVVQLTRNGEDLSRSEEHTSE